MKRKGASTFEFKIKSIKTEANTWCEFHNGENTTAERILESEHINPKRADL